MQVSPPTFWCIITNSHWQNEMHFVPTFCIYGDLTDFCWWRKTLSFHKHGLSRGAVTCRGAAPLGNFSVHTLTAWNYCKMQRDPFNLTSLSCAMKDVYMVKRCKFTLFMCNISLVRLLMNYSRGQEEHPKDRLPITVLGIHLWKCLLQEYGPKRSLYYFLYYLPECFVLWNSIIFPGKKPKNIQKLEMC